MNKTMKPKKIWANLAVDNVLKTQEFYTKLGFRSNGSPTKELVIFFVGDDDFIIHFFEKDRLKSSLEGDVSDLEKGNEIMFTLAAESTSEVDTWVNEVKKIGGKIFFDPKKDKKALYDENNFYVCVFSDLDGHKWNVLYNPGQKA